MFVWNGHGTYQLYERQADEWAREHDDGEDATLVEVILLGEAHPILLPKLGVDELSPPHLCTTIICGDHKSQGLPLWLVRVSP